MRKMLGLLGATVGGWAGWALGSPGGIFGSFVVSMVGTGVGLYVGYRVAARYS